jgi:uncharacterized protein (TIRG00374 family)
VLAAATAAGLYVGLPEIAGLHDTWGRLSSGNPLWLCAAAVLEIASYGAYICTFHRLFALPGSRIGWRECYDISLAGVAASRLLAMAGAGGIALTAWALQRSGMNRRTLVSGLTIFYVALYGVFMAALVLTGVGLRSSVLPGPAPFALTVVPALFGAVVIIAALAFAALPADPGRRDREGSPGPQQATSRLRRALRRIAPVKDGVRGAIRLARDRDIALLGALGWWALDIAVLGACFRAFGAAPPAAVVIMAYFTGMLGNVLPLPGGLGGVEGGMIGALLAFGVDGGVAVAAVLSYRAFAYWLPIIPGALAYFRLVRTVADWQRRATRTGRRQA